MSGKYKSNNDGNKSTNSVKWGSDWEDGDDYRRLDYGLQVGAGIEKSVITVQNENTMLS